MKALRIAGWFLIASIAIASCVGAETDSGFLVAVHADNPVEEVSCREVEKFFLKQVKTWQNCVPVQPVDQSEDSPVRELFSTVAHGKKISAIRSYWQRMIFSGRRTPPPEVAGDREVLAFVAADPGAVGYVSRDVREAEPGIAAEFATVKLLDGCVETSVYSAPPAPCAGTDLAERREGDGVATPADSRVILVLDVSGSMAGKIDGVRKIDVARVVIGDLLSYWDPDVHLGLSAYGHRGAGSGRVRKPCEDVELLIPVGPPEPATIATAVRALEPAGMTPLTLAVREVATALRSQYRDEPARVVLVSDGQETCGGDPCTIARDLGALGVDFTAYVVGFDIRDEATRGQLRCLAESSGGGFDLADDESSLRRALSAAFENATDGRLDFPFDDIGPKPAPKSRTGEPPRLAYVPAGRFAMGSPATESGREEDETPHRVTVTRGFFVTETEVTQQQWREFDGGRPAFFDDCGPRCPVERVNWFEALLFANRLSVLANLGKCYELRGCEGKAGTGCAAGEKECPGDFVCSRVKFRGLDCTGFRLPTEAEWELAARTSTTAPFVNGDRLTAADARFAAGGQALGPVAVRGYSANPSGLFDVHGNVGEWVWDQAGPYSQTPAADPLSSLEAGREALRGVRGGSWSEQAAACRSADREWKDPRLRSASIGFRLVKTE